ncbi:MAG: class I SAM-dependent methyltransferase [Candidatus Delongbacteria bacterium]|nr:class I SAM-dependent methyltransferase [Candidatus Delongbacteria bacterium]
MLDRNEFDQWAGSYDETISKSSKGYPFEGYYEVLGYVQNSIEVNVNLWILDLGIGTGLLTNELYRKGVNIVGVDFSKKMIEEAIKKMPKGIFVCYDFNENLPTEITKKKFDYIVSSYAIHHVNDERKLELIKQLSNILSNNGKIIIADIAFENQKHLDLIKSETSAWDDDEYYIVADNLLKNFEQSGFYARYNQISKCAGVIEIGRKV